MISVVEKYYKKAGVIPFLLKGKIARLEKNPDLRRSACWYLKLQSSNPDSFIRLSFSALLIPRSAGTTECLLRDGFRR